MKTKKVNKFKKASSKLAFLFACAIVVSPCITSFQSCATTSEEIHSEITRSNNDNEITVARFSKTMKHANRKNVDTISKSLNSFNSELNTLELNFKLCNACLNDGNDEYNLYNNLSLTYNLNSNTFTYCEFEVEFSEGAGNVYFLDYFTPNNFLNYLNTYDTFSNAKIDTSTTYNEIAIYAEEESGNIIFEQYFTLSGDNFSSIQYFGERFYISDIVFEVQSIKNLITNKYDLGYQHGNSSGYENGYNAGRQEGYENGYNAGRQEGYDNGYDNGYDYGYEQARQDTLFSYVGPLVNLPLQYGLYNVNTDKYDYSNEVELNLNYTDYIELLNGGFKITDWSQYENKWVNDEVNHSDYMFSFTIPFGENGVRIENINKLFPINSNNVPRLDFGQELIIKTTTNTYVWNGADDYALQYIDFETFQNGVLKNSLITSIQMTGGSADYIPYGLMTNNDYSLGYENGFDSGFTSGKLEGRQEGYENGFDDGKIASGTTYADGYNKGYLDAKNQYQNVEAISFEDVLSAVITAPNKIIREGFDFDILGINVGSFIQTCIVIGLIVFTIGLFKKG